MEKMSVLVEQQKVTFAANLLSVRRRPCVIGYNP